MRILRAALALAALTACALARAQTPPEEPPAPGPQVIVPDVERQDVRIVHIPSRDFEFGIFAGTYSADNFGSNTVYGGRLGYHITEDFFLESALGQTTVTDTSFRNILPGGLFPNPRENLRYYNLSLGYNILPGEIFLGKDIAKVSAFYLIAGLGNTEFLNTSHQTFNAGFGTRVFLRSWAALQLDLRDHIFTQDILGTRRNTQNLELTGGVTLFF